MEEINALDYSLPKNPFNYISEVEVDTLKFDPSYVSNVKLSSYGKYIIEVGLFPGIYSVLNDLEKIRDPFKEIGIKVCFSDIQGNKLIVKTSCVYDHYVLDGSMIKFVFYKVSNKAIISVDEVSATSYNYYTGSDNVSQN